MTRRTGQKKIRVGVIGVGRGQSFMQGAANTGMELVAICDTWKARLQQVGKKFKVKTYADYDQFLTHDMDAVVLANYCHDHAPFAVKALNAGFHVMSECIAARTMGSASIWSRRSRRAAGFTCSPRTTPTWSPARNSGECTTPARLETCATRKASTTIRAPRIGA